MTSAKQPGRPMPIRLVGTYDETGLLLFSKGFKNFSVWADCGWCHTRKPLMHHYAVAKKGDSLDFSDAAFCSVRCYRNRRKSPFQEILGGLQPEDDKGL